MNRLMRNLSDSFIHKFGGDSYRAPSTKRAQQEHKRDNLKRELGPPSAFVADFIKQPPFAMLPVVLLPSSNRCDTDPESLGGLLGSDVFGVSRASGAVIPDSFETPCHGCKRLSSSLPSAGALFPVFRRVYLFPATDDSPPRSARLSFSHRIHLLSSLRPIRWNRRLILI